MNLRMRVVLMVSILLHIREEQSQGIVSEEQNQEEQIPKNQGSVPPICLSSGNRDFSADEGLPANPSYLSGGLRRNNTNNNSSVSMCSVLVVLCVVFVRSK